MTELMSKAVVMFVNHSQRPGQRCARVMRQDLTEYRDIFRTTKPLGIITTRKNIAMHSAGSVGQRESLVQQVTAEPVQAGPRQNGWGIGAAPTVAQDRIMSTDYHTCFRVLHNMLHQRFQRPGGHLVICIKKN